MFFRGLLVNDPPERQIRLNVKNFGELFIFNQPASLDARRRLARDSVTPVNNAPGSRTEVASRRADAVGLLKLNKRRLGSRAEVGRLVARRTRAAGRDYVPSLIKILLEFIDVLAFVP